MYIYIYMHYNVLLRMYMFSILYPDCSTRQAYCATISYQLSKLQVQCTSSMPTLLKR